MTSGALTATTDTTVTRSGPDLGPARHLSCRECGATTELGPFYACTECFGPLDQQFFLAQHQVQRGRGGGLSGHPEIFSLALSCPRSGDVERPPWHGPSTMSYGVAEAAAPEDPACAHRQLNTAHPEGQRERPDEAPATAPRSAS